MAGLVEMRLDATSANYPNVESLYPIRYRFRTWSMPDAGQLVGFETYEKSRKIRHRLYLRDASELGVQRPMSMPESGVTRSPDWILEKYPPPP